MEEYKIRYNYDKNKHVGQNGDSKVGDMWPAAGGQRGGKRTGRRRYAGRIILKWKFR